VILNRRVGPGAPATTDLNLLAYLLEPSALLAYLLEPGADRIGALDFQTPASEYLAPTTSARNRAGTESAP
jgi:hypothetical protein